MLGPITVSSRNRSRLHWPLTTYAVPFQGARKAPHRQPLQITTRTQGPDFKLDLLLLQPPLVGGLLLVFFPPIIDMLKFSGHSYLIRDEPDEMVPSSVGPSSSAAA